ncbi:hypothetical protein AMATHDRAFT_196089 [Amanita thiersii Skay4041]|uniref:NADH:flavin oxidoreductase/NADH oxidase N-terminal domain-containing protein n=1 Tax=Amanita thiersii Skay4041 TaxID=703135 RepID=A0A2A9NLV2_9AGAR|nr:hypothetical protein AMATHDRAFT_196089 [Amanita thiersii Skay4041]
MTTPQRPSTDIGDADSAKNPEALSTLATVLSPVTLPCGRTITNRLVKVALYEHLAFFYGGPPNSYHVRLYDTWAQFNWGMIMTGNVQVAKTHLSLGRDVVVPEELTEESMQPFKKLASAIHGVSSKPLAVMQLSHGGRQSCRFIGGRRMNQAPLAPSPIRVTGRKKGALSRLTHHALFQVPKEMTLEDIDDVAEAFVKGANLAWKSGFDGVQLHVAHGYLLSQFVSPKTNRRTDQYSAEPENALRLVRRIVDGIRDAAPKDFIIGIKINSADYVHSDTAKDDTTDGDRALEHVLSIAKWGNIDFIEISGGDYEDPGIAKSPRQAFFAQFSHRVLKALDTLTVDTKRPLMLLTGGLRTPSLLCSVISSGHADLLGIGRASVLRPDLPVYLQELYDASDSDALDSPFEREPHLEYPTYLRHWSLKWLGSILPSIPLIGAGVTMAWYSIMLRRIGTRKVSSTDSRKTLKPNYGLGGFRAVVKLWFWVAKGDQT